MRHMRMYLLTAPRWVVGLGSGLLIATVVAVVFQFDNSTRSWTASVLTGVVFGALLGGGLVLSLTMQRSELREAAGELPPAQLSAAYRAAVWGEIPRDPVVRAAAARVAQRRLETLRRPAASGRDHRDCHDSRHRAARAGRQLRTRGVLAVAGLGWIVEFFQPARLQRRLELLSAENGSAQSV
jgi:MFS family permease